MKPVLHDILALIQRPEVYAPSTAPFWNDDHISKGMLEAHLNPNWDAATRSLPFVDQSVAWIHSLFPSKQYNQLLDLGCGPGIYAERFHQKGYRVTGVDLSTRSIEYAKGQAKAKQFDIHYLNKNYNEMNFKQTYDVITLIYCDYPVLPKDVRIRLLQTIRHALNHGGAFIFDVFTPNQYLNDQESTQWYGSEKGGFWSPESQICLSRHLIYENQVRLDETIVITDQSYQVYRIWDTAFEVQTITEELKLAGFHDIQIYGDIAGTPYTEQSKTIGIVAR